ncbi:tight adherence protein B [Raineyella antarctica]|uniref:Tight adherence protein B n=1 Tax=Raineyella antarctica TaxID=1577474 RepID=A0A1G6GFH6_9ACTN|nr:hypothetical protein [Raineyella antarctica]SDB80747.1 tight adherence protein B [Raineyella antarctica]
MSAVLWALAAAAAIARWWGPMPAPALPRLVDQPVAASRQVEPRRRPRRWLALAGGAITLVAACTALGGATIGLLVTVALLVGATAVTLLRSRRAGQRRQAAEAEVARACSLLAAEVRAGRPPESAVEVVAADCPVLAPAAGALAVGEDAVRIWAVQATGAGHGGLEALARAWAVSRACGAPMGPALDQVARALEQDAEVGRTIRGELASAQATGQLMSVLPLVGIGLGYTIGGHPLDFLLDDRIGQACTLVATVLACAGTLWTHALGRRPARGG